MRRLFHLALLSLLAAGCSKDSPTQPPQSQPPVTDRRSWVGSFDDGVQSGDVIIDLAQNGSTLTGEIVMSNLGLEHAYLTGTIVSDSVNVHLDPSHGGTATDLVITGRVQSNRAFDGRLVFVPNSLDAPLDCRVLPVRNVTADQKYPSTLDVISLAWDGNRIWLGTSGHDYVRMDVAGTLTDTVVVIHTPNAHWVSSVLAWDGTRMWGAYPITIQLPGGAHENVSDVLGFDTNGPTGDSLRLGHRPAGLASAGPYSWSLRKDPTALVRFDETGTVTDSVHVEVPDPYGLDFDGIYFWTVGWYMRRLYMIDVVGRVRFMCDLPHDLPAPFALGVAIEGIYVWYGEGNVGQTVLHRMTVQ